MLSGKHSAATLNNSEFELSSIFLKLLLMISNQTPISSKVFIFGFMTDH